MEKAIRRYWPIFVLPTFLAFILGFIAPFAMGVYLSFCKFTTVTDAKFIGFSNYLKIFTDASFVHALWYTAIFTVVTVVLINVLAFAVALLLTKGFRGTNIFRTVFFMPNLIGGIILGYIWQLLLNGVLLYMNRTLTYSSVYGFWGLVILMCWQQIGYMMIIYIAGLQAVPEDMLEAARIDGANRWQQLFGVQLPLALPSIMAGINQTTMMALSMVVIASMIGARGLGEDVLVGIQTLNVGKGLEAGLAIVILAVVIDRITQAYGRSRHETSK